MFWARSVPVFVRVTGFGEIEVVEKIDSSAAIIDPVSVSEGQQASAIVQKVRETVMDSINSQKASFSNIIWGTTLPPYCNLNSRKSAQKGNGPDGV
ncbi:hypothetical protein C5167_031255 [Papaver somniferum]|nr:hypothetical protein C5167_031255 [Papaver somniferum]